MALRSLTLKMVCVFLLIATLALPSRAEERFKSLVGNVKTGKVADDKTISVPYITWGGDMATFYANGGTRTKKGSIFDVGMLDDILHTARLSWKDIKVIWADYLTGTDKSPAAMFRKSGSIDACFVITPDMIGLCGGLDSTGSGAEGTVKGARVLVSTAELSRSIADVYV